MLLQAFYSIRSSAVLAQPRVKRLVSTDHFSVDGTLIEGLGFDGSGGPPAEGGGRNTEAGFHGQKRPNQTRASTTDPDARLYRKGKGKEAKLCFMGHGLMENRHGAAGRYLPDAGRRACRTCCGAAHDRASVPKLLAVPT